MRFFFALAATACFSLQDVRNEVCSALARYRGESTSATWSDKDQDCIFQIKANLGDVVSGEKRLVLSTKKIRKKEKLYPTTSYVFEYKSD